MFSQLRALFNVENSYKFHVLKASEDISLMSYFLQKELTLINSIQAKINYSSS